MRETIGIVFICFFFSTLSPAQTFPFRTYSIDKGLSEAVVNDMIQDHQGYIWVATSYGLNRFDGTAFKNYYEQGGLKNNKIFSLYEGTSNTIWVGTGGGVNIIKQDSIQTRAYLRQLDSSRILAIFEDQHGEFWFATDGQGVWQLDRDHNLTDYTTANGLASNRVQAITEDQNGNIWFGTSDGLSRLKDGNFRTFSTEDGLAGNNILDLMTGSHGKTLWIATRSGLSRFSNGAFKNYMTADGLVSNRVQSIAPDSSGGLWLGTEEGVSHFRNGKFSNISSRQGLINNKIYCTLFDRERNIWFGTFGNGITLFLGEQFKNYTMEQGLPNNVITSVTEDGNGTHWITTFGGGLTRLKDHQLTNYNENDHLVSNNAYTAFVNQKNHLIIGTQWGLSLYDGTKFTNYGVKELPYHEIRAIAESKEHSDEYWLGTYGNGLLRYKNDTFTTYSIADGLSNDKILSVQEGPTGDIWIASYGGVSRFSNGKFTNYTVKQGLPNNGVLDILVTNAGQIWASTFGGIARYDKKSDSFQAITARDGLPDDVCYFIEQDDNGIFWIGAKTGVIRFDYDTYRKLPDGKKSRQTFELITQQQGLVANEMNAGAAYKDREGRLWFGSVGGLTVYDPSKASRSYAPPNVHIESVRLSGETLPADHHLQVESNSRNITFQYLGISYRAPDQVVYEYRLKGAGEDWQHTRQRSVRYSSLFPGDYTFQIKARNSEGLWSARTATLSFTVLAPFWLKWWFFIIIALVLAGIIAFLYNYYRVRKMVDIERMRVRIASDLHDDVGSSLTEIALESDFLQTSDASDHIKQSLRNIGNQSRKIVSSLDDIVWSIDARNDTLGDLTDRMQDYISNMLSGRRVTYQFDELNTDKKLTVDTKENLYLIFKEAVNNIAKHSNATKVEVNLTTNGNSFNLKIHDNGTDVSAERKTGHGLRNMQMRADRIDASVKVKRRQGFTVQVQGSYNQ